MLAIDESDDNWVPSKVQVFSACRGLLSVITEGELADSWGLKFNNCIEYHRVYVPYEDWNTSTHPYRVGKLCMDPDLVELVK